MVKIEGVIPSGARTVERTEGGSPAAPLLLASSPLGSLARMAMKKTKTTKTRSTATAMASPPPDAAAPADSAATGSQAEVERYLPQALALAEGDVLPYRADATLAFHNVTRGLEALLEREAEARALPNTDVDALRLLPDQCRAVAFAAAAVPGAAAASAIGPKLVRARALRKKLFRGADALVDAGLFPEKAVDVLHAGSGTLDTARDCVGLAALYRKHADKTRGKTAVTAAEVREASELGDELLTLLKPSRTKTVRAEDVRKAADQRDRLWTLVRRGYDALWRACAYLYGAEGVAARVPALQARVSVTTARRKANAAKREE